MDRIGETGTYPAAPPQAGALNRIVPGAALSEHDFTRAAAGGACILHGPAVHTDGMIVRSVRHRGLRQLLEKDSTRFLKQDLAERVRGIMTALALAEDMEGFVEEAAPGWRVHRLSGERQNEWSVRVSANWRITFEERDGAIERLNLEDYH